MGIRNFRIIKIGIRKERSGRDPRKPSINNQIPEHKLVKFRSGKEMKEQLDAGVSTESETPPPHEPGASFGSE